MPYSSLEYLSQPGRVDCEDDGVEEGVLVKSLKAIVAGFVLVGVGVLGDNELTNQLLSGEKYTKVPTIPSTINATTKIM
ncbi:MAG: hypothetical protein Q7S61_03325 [bacterium]|nr:hypothetical protein [bacterium]